MKTSQRKSKWDASGQYNIVSEVVDLEQIPIQFSTTELTHDDHNQQLMEKVQLVFVPVPGIGHLVPKIEFAKRLLDRDDRFSITVLLINSLFDPVAPAYIQSVAESHPQIRFIHLPLSHFSASKEVHKSVDKFITDFIDSHKPYVKEAIVKHVLSSFDSVPLAGLVVDFFCASMIDVGNELGVPSYLFSPSTAASIGLLLYLPARHDQVGREFEEGDGDLVIPSYVNPVPSSGLPSGLLNKFGGYISLVNLGRRFKETKGIIVNTYEELESHAVKSLPNIDDHIPPVYTVGPLIDLKGQSNQLQSDVPERDEIMKWLDNQPGLSVVFLCFGSQGSFGEEQVKEIAVGLEQSGHRFLWSLRKPPPKNKFAVPSDYKTSDLQEVLPNGFLERTKEMGKVCGWAPQKEVLAHASVGGFVSHCGWNSILESLWFGVPIVTWPMYAEQQINAFELVKDLGMAVEMRLDYRNTNGEVVLGDEIARAIRCVMDSDNEVRKRVKQESEKSRLAVMDGGSSFAAYGRLIQDIFRNIP